MAMTLGGLADFAGFNCPEPFRKREFHSAFIYSSEHTYHSTCLCICRKEDLPINAELILCCAPVNGYLCVDTESSVTDVFNICCQYMIYCSKVTDACSRLSGALLSGKGFVHILQEAGQLFNNPLLLVNSRYRVVSSYAPERITDPFLSSVVKEGAYPENYIKTMFKRNVSVHRDGLISTIITDSEDARRIMTKELSINGVNVGYIMLIEENEFAPSDTLVFSYLCRVLSVEVRGRGALGTSNMRDEDYLLLDMLEEKLKGAYLKSKLSATNVDFEKAKKRLLVFKPKENAEYGHANEFIIDAISQQLGRCPSVIYKDMIVCLVNDRDLNSYVSNDGDFSSFLKYYSYQCGISNIVSNPENLSIYYNQAIHVIILGSRILEPGPFYQHEEYILLEMLDLINNGNKDTSLLLEFCSQTYLQIREYDETHKTSYTKTFETYVECGYDLQLTAERLFVHKNTILYRLKRIEELFGINSTDTKEMMSVYLSIMIMRYLGTENS
ncbi:MAG: helix-turn-helix domain-containing protein [Oscillospiraceae bacterium]|nr:helix-turn-helix domain-containing protein [Oscillospiraceae bacterium]